MTKIQTEKTWKFDKSGDYYNDLAMRESTNNISKVNELGYIGRYQMGESSLVDTGHYKKDPKLGQEAGKQYNNDWTGRWTGKQGINSREAFLSNEKVQDIAVREYHKIIWDRYLPDYHKYEGQEIGGIKLTKSGMISCSHLRGSGGFKEFVKSGGKAIITDFNGTTCSEYLKGFEGYEVDYSTDKLTEALERSQKEVELKDPNKTSSSLSAYEKALACDDIYNKLIDKFNNLLLKFAGIKDKELNQERENCNAKINNENNASLSEMQSQLDLKREELITKFNAEVESVLNARVAAANANAHITHPKGGTIVINAEDVKSAKTQEANQILDNLKAQLEKELKNKAGETSEREKKLYKDKETSLKDQIYTHKEEFKNYLDQIRGNMKKECDKTDGSNIVAIENDAEQFVDNLQHMMGLDNQQADSL